ncbi:hypothetical protein L4C34_18745 [Vibrio profundum]|uniref:imm11 family protein n=1 Tax=Vibrio profundum TaxID=2910247 RepID=UPI003D123239
MKSLEEQYYILLDKPNRESFLELKGIKGAGSRHYTFKKLDYGDGPLFFENALKGNMPFYLSNVQMDGGIPVVSKDIAKEIERYNIEGFQLFPSIIISDDGQWHEDFYYFNLYKKVDCVDFFKSEVLGYDPNEMLGHDVVKYHLNNDVLNNINEESRLIIKLDNVFSRSVIVHEKIVNIFMKFNIDAFVLYKLSEYRQGMEFINQQSS